MHLFRGDKLANKLTDPKRYRFDGIRSKAFGKGDPAYIQRTGLVESLRQHINPETLDDREFYHKTDFISFSRSSDRSMFWLRDKNSIEIIKSNEFDETRYLFILEVEDEKLVELEPGIYLYAFACNPKLRKMNSDDIISNSVLHLTYSYNNCEICKGSFSAHRIILIDTVKFLMSKDLPEKFQGALNNAILDKEWLILPLDKMNKKVNFTSIPRANFWKVEHFKEL
ncbi:hypothetical protein [Cyclobacterium sp. SYSU L10401]|uniref:hypothetical protein n=1 Tax=Cyclobacterium sp. SYSU L10401 TaxID=2678657 RepID=UPI0013CF476B|nr:hypothetical protein [Cyclobacterium sp. SYSU L10401]